MRSCVGLFCRHFEVPRQTAETARKSLLLLRPRNSPPVVCTLPFRLCGGMNVAFLLYDVSNHCLCVAQYRDVCYTATFRYHTQTEWASPWILSSPSFYCPRQHWERHMKPLTLVSHVSQNDIQLTEISLLHRRHRQSGLTAEIDASSPRPPPKHIHPPPQSYFSMKQQLTPNRCS